MMAFDSRSTPEPRALSEDTRHALCTAIVHLWQEPAADNGPLPAALERMVREARERALRAEEVIIAFKGLLAGIPELNAPERRLESARFRERLITLCIKTYYMERAG